MEYLIGNFLLCLLYAVVIYGLLPFSTKKKNIVFGLITFIQLTIVHGLVDINVMADLPGYKDAFDVIAKEGLFADTTSSRDSSPIEFGYQLYMWIVSLVTSNFQLFLVFNSLFLLFFYYKFIFKYSPYLWFSILILLLTTFNQSLCGLRQHLSIAVLLMSIPFVLKRDIKCFFCIFLIAYFLHKSSLIFAPVYFIYGIKRIKILLLVYFMIGIIFFLSNSLIHNFAYLFSRQNELDIDENLYGIATKGIIMLAALLFYILALKRKILEDGINKLVFIISSIGVIGNSFIGGVGSGRALLSYYVILIIQIPIALSFIHNLLFRVIYVVSTISLFFAFAFFLASDAKYWMVYQLIFEINILS